MITSTAKVTWIGAARLEEQPCKPATEVFPERSRYLAIFFDGLSVQILIFASCLDAQRPICKPIT
jgi:hypothetical protein